MEELKIHNTTEPISSEASSLRKEMIRAFYVSGGGHYGGALSVLDILLVLYRNFLHISISKPDHPNRDRFILSKGHAAMAYYAVLKKIGFTGSSLDSFGQIDSPYEGHPDMDKVPGIDFSSGSLGQGLSVGLGMALALRPIKAKVWVVLGDGECQEGQVWETAMIAHRYSVDNLVAIIDCNHYQEWGWNYSKDIPHDPVIAMKKKWAAFGWNVLETDGHDYDEMMKTFKIASSITGMPTVIIARTVKGKGFAMIEADPQRFHCSVVDSFEQKQIDNDI